MGTCCSFTFLPRAVLSVQLSNLLYGVIAFPRVRAFPFPTKMIKLD